MKVGEPTSEETVEILKGLRSKYEAHHKVKITDEAITQAVKMSVRYISDRFLPDKAIDLIDEACSKVRLGSYTLPPEVKEIENLLKETTAEKAAAIDSQDFEGAAKLRDKEKELLSRLTAAKTNWKEEAARTYGEVTGKDIAKVVSSWTGVPVNELTQEESERLLRLEEILHERIVGQKKAVEAVYSEWQKGEATAQSLETDLKTRRDLWVHLFFSAPPALVKPSFVRHLAVQCSAMRIPLSAWI